MVPLEIIVKGDTSAANTALQKTQQAITGVAVAAKKTDDAISTFSRNGATSMFTLTERIKAFQSQVFTEKDRNKIAIYNAEIKATEVELAKLQAVGVASGNGIAAGAGKAFSAVRQLAYILPGVGIAGIIGFATEPIIKYIGALFTATDAEKKLIETQKEFNADVSKDYGKESASLEVLRASIESVTVPMEKRLQAIKDLKKEFPGLFDGLTNEQLLTGKVANAYDLATAAILRKARATAAQNQLEKIAAEKLAILEKAEKDRQATIDLSNSKKGAQILSSGGTGGGGFSGQTEAQVKRDILLLYNARAKGNQDLINQLNKQEAFYLKIAVEGADRVIELEKEKVKKIKAIREDFVRTVPFVGGFYLPNEKVPPLTARPDLTIIPNVKEVIITDEAKQKVLDGIQSMFDAAALKKFQEQATAAVAQTLSNIMQDSISTAADAIGDALAGGQDVVPKLFDGLIKGIGGQIKELGKYLVKAGIEMLAAKKAIKALGLTPQTAIIAGIALEVLGAVLVAAATKKSNNVGFATGTRNSPSGSFLVGERGPERIFLPAGSAVQPNNELQAYGGGGITLQPSIQYSADGFRIMLNRTDARWSRNN